MIHGGFILKNKLCRSKDYKDCIHGYPLTEMHKTLKNQTLNLFEFPANKHLYSSVLRGIFLLVKANMDPLCPWGRKDLHDSATKQTFTEYFYVPDTVLRAS